MTKLKYVLLTVVLAFLSQTAAAQLNPIKQFSEDPIKFLEEVRIMFEATNMDKKEIKVYMETFTLAWNSPKCNETVKKATYNTCNLMVKKKLRILPEYKSYLNSIMNFV
ncbi:MAG: hypothetical protein L6Q66_14440, partial [Bacteroidia bacterium]|nr:hypothetical protein [Bacteroidia bacterium]